MKKNETFPAASENKKPLRKAYIDTEPPLKKGQPTGPIRTAAEQHQGDLLLFVPRNELSRMVNTLTGRYGYSHLAVDCGEIDEPTNRRVMIEVTVEAGVHYGFQDEYGRRPFVRIPLRKAGIDVQGFCQCIHAKVGEKFDDLEALTLGILDNPARQICSDLATVCLPEEMREEIARCHQRAVVHPLSAVRDPRSDSRVRLFMSPNGFAEFLGAPRGNKLTGPDQLVEPHLRASSSASFLPKLWKRSDTLMTSAWRRFMHR